MRAKDKVLALSGILSGLLASSQNRPILREARGRGNQGDHATRRRLPDTNTDEINNWNEEIDKKKAMKSRSESKGRKKKRLQRQRQRRR